MMHPLAGVFLVTEESYRRERAISNFGPFRRHRGAVADPATSPAVTLPRQRTDASAQSAASQPEPAHHQHAA